MVRQGALAILYAAGAAGVTPGPRHVSVTQVRMGSGFVMPQNHNDPAGGIPAGSSVATWEVLMVVNNSVQRGEALPQEITQTSEVDLALQSTTCSLTIIVPLSRWARGAALWVDRVARVE